MLFSEGTDSSRINVLTKLKIETHLVLQGNATFRSSLYSPLPLVPFSANIAYVRTNQMWSMFRLESSFGDFLGTSLITLLSPLWFSALVLQILNT